jgi:hypothetical protein
MLEDTGERDEYGMEPADDLFSSPEKRSFGKTHGNGYHQTASDDEQDMDIDEGMRASKLHAWITLMYRSLYSRTRDSEPYETG